jgi:hypothetical protein
VDHGRSAVDDGREQGGNGRIAAEAHHHVGPHFLEEGAGLQGALQHGGAGADHAQRIAATEGGGRQADAMRSREILSETGHALVGGEHNGPAARDQRFGQGLGRKQMTPGSPGGDNRSFHGV